LYRSKNTYNPKRTTFTNLGYKSECPAGFTVEKNTCIPNNPYTCPSIGLKDCMIKGCSITTTDCNNFKADAAI